MANGITIPFTKSERERLGRLAFRFGLNIPQFSRRVLTEVISEIATESLDDYENPRALRTSLNRALRDFKAGRVRSRL